ARGASLLQGTGRTEEALATYREAGELLAPLAPSSAEARSALAKSRLERGRFLSAIGRSTEALAAYRLARTDLESMARAPEADNQVRHDLGETIRSIGLLLGETGRLGEAEAEYRRALARLQKLGGEHPTATHYRS